MKKTHETHEVIVRLAVIAETEDWGAGDTTTFYRLQDDFELVSTTIPKNHWGGVAEHWAQSDDYYEIIQNLVGVFDE